jgi:molybdopterin-guanine dinucleotide biosynthesis protein A
LDQSTADAVVARVDGHLQPLHATFRGRCATPLATAFASGQRSVVAALSTLQVKEVVADASDVGSLSYVDVDTPEQFDHFR